MDQAILELTETALSHLTPQDQQLFARFFMNFQDAYLELLDHPLRDRFTAEEDAHISRYVNQVVVALDRLGSEDVQRLEFIWFYWIGMIEHLEESRALSFSRRRSQIQERLDNLPIITSPTLTSIPDGETLGCLVCMEQLAQSQETIIQLPCHPSHLFHRDCIQRWLEGSLGCPTCRAEVELPPWRIPQ